MPAIELPISRFECEVDESIDLSDPAKRVENMYREKYTIQGK